MILGYSTFFKETYVKIQFKKNAFALLDLSFPKSVNPCYTYDTEETRIATRYQVGGIIVPPRTA